MKKKIFVFILMLMPVYLLSSFLFGATDKVVIIDNMDSMQGWQVFSQGLTTQIKEDSGRKGMALLYELNNSRDWVVVSKIFPSLTLPSRFKLTFYIRGISPDNNLELKFIDKKGNVFWKKWENFKFSPQWQKIELPSSEIKFGWGPDSSGKLGQVDKIELGVSKGSGGKGEFMVSGFAFSPDENLVKTSASSFEGADLSPDNVVDNSKKSRWSSHHSDPQWLVIDYGKIKEIVGLTLYWELAYGKAYDIQVSTDEENWQTVYSTDHGDGGIDEIEFDPVKARYVKFYGRQRGSYWGYSLYELVLKTTAEPWGEGEIPNVLMKHSFEFSTNVQSMDKTFSSKFYIPASWKDTEPVFQMIDRDPGTSLSINGRNVAELPAGLNKFSLNIKKYLRPDSLNTVAVTLKNFKNVQKPFSTVIVASDTNAYQIKLKKMREEDPKAYYYYLAETEPEGSFPYWMNKQQGFWTVVGIDKDFKESLFYEDGTLEPYKSFTIAPFLYLNDRLITRQDVKLAQTQEKDYLPLPCVQWNNPDAELDIKSFPGGNENSAVTYMQYTVRNKGVKKIKGKLFLAIRPFEINPPWQWGGFNNIHDIKQNNAFIEVNEYRIFPLSPLSGFGAVPFAKDDILRYIEKGGVPADTAISDPSGFGTAAMEYDFELESSGEKDFFIAVPLYKNASPVNSVTSAKTIPELKSEMKRIFNESVSFWTKKLNPVSITLPDPEIFNTLRANLGYIFVNKDGPAIQPGSRSYEAAWMRDGAMTSLSLLRMGYSQEVKEYIDWYSQFIYKDGRVPAIVIIGRNEINPVKEFDSQGEFVFLVWQYYQFTKDKKFLEEKFPEVLQSLQYLEALHKQRTTSEYMNATGDKRRFYNILPNSVSHEGYYPEPGTHSYWDDFWALRGWKDGNSIAKVLGKNDLLKWMSREEKELRSGLYDSILQTIRNKNINYIPGCAELGDFDATSTSIAVMVAGEKDNLPEPYFSNTFDKYYIELMKRFEPGWHGSFSSYETRTVQSLLLMGQKERAWTLFDYLLTCRKPLGWRQWSEAIYFPYRDSGYIGDMPHTWGGSGYVSTVRNMLVLEKDEKLILGDGIKEKWLESKDGVAIENFPTIFGKISYKMKKENNILVVNVTGEAKPRDGFIFQPPTQSSIKKILINSREVKMQPGNEIRFLELPAEIQVSY